jgi:hypothetical protein
MLLVCHEIIFFTNEELKIAAPVKGLSGAPDIRLSHKLGVRNKP